MDLAEAEEMLAASKRYPELVTMLCPPPMGMRADLLVKNSWPRITSAVRTTCDCKVLPATIWIQARRRIGGSGLKLADSTFSRLGFTLKCCSAGSETSMASSRAAKLFTQFVRATKSSSPICSPSFAAFDNGAEGVLEFSGIDALAPSDRVEIYGSSGTLTYDFGSDVVQAGKVGDRGLHVVELPAELETEWRVEEDFLAAVKSKGRVRPHPNFEDGLRYMRVVQAVADSRAGNEWVAIKR